MACVALGSEIRHSRETLDLLKDYVVQLRRYGSLESSVREVPAADGLTTAYLFQGTTLVSSFINRLQVEHYANLYEPPYQSIFSTLKGSTNMNSMKEDYIKTA